MLGRLKNIVSYVKSMAKDMLTDGLKVNLGDKKYEGSHKRALCQEPTLKEKALG
jgi:hypothetical protein